MGKGVWRYPLARCAAFIAKARSWVAEEPPEERSTSRPATKTAKVGMERIPMFPAMIGCASVFDLGDDEFVRRRERRASSPRARP